MPQRTSNPRHSSAPVSKAQRLADAHPGFKKAAGSIARKKGIPIAQAKAILAKGARNASPAAKRRNPRLKKVKGGKSK